MSGALPPSILLLVAGYVVSAVGSLAISGYAYWTRRDEPTMRLFAAFTLAVTVWSFGLTGRVLSTTVSAKLGWAFVAYLGVVSFPVTWLLFTLSYTGSHRWVNRRLVALLLVHPVVTMTALATTSIHGLFYTDVSLSYATGWPLLATTPGVMFWLHAGYGYVVFLAGVGLLVNHVFRSSYPYRRQSQVLVVAALLAWLVNVTYVTGVRPLPNVNLTPLALGIGSVVLGLAVFRIRFIDLVPVARETVLDRIEDAIFVVDDRGRIVDVNARARMLFGPEAIGEPAAAVVPDEFATAELAADEVSPNATDREADEAPEDGRDGGREVEIEGKSGRRWYWVRSFPVDADASRGRIVVLTDVTDQRNQRALLERQNEQLDGLADIVSHDLRNPLDVLRGNLSMVRETVDDDSVDRRGPPLTDRFRAIDRSVDRIEEIARDLVVLARQGEPVEAGTATTTEAAAKAAWSTVDTGALTLIVEHGETVEADSGRLQQLFENLFRNVAVHASDARRVWIGSLANRPTAEPSTVAGSNEERSNGGSPNEQRAMPDEAITSTGFYVEDDGPGIPEVERGLVFEYGHSGRDDGSGLGLAIVHEIVTAHGWQIGIVDGRRGGARFEIVVPTTPDGSGTRANRG